MRETTVAEKVAAAEAAVKAGGCPACSSMRAKPYKLDGRAMIGVKECAACAAVFGECYLGTSYEIVKPAWATTEPAPGTTRYFDFTTLGSIVGRRHGWFDPATRLITQVG